MASVQLSNSVRGFVYNCTRAHTRYVESQAARNCLECPPDEKRRIEREWTEIRLKLADAVLAEFGGLDG